VELRKSKIVETHLIAAPSFQSLVKGVELALAVAQMDKR
jgi:hypothetical protein